VLNVAVKIAFEYASISAFALLLASSKVLIDESVITAQSKIQSPQTIAFIVETEAEFFI